MSNATALIKLEQAPIIEFSEMDARGLEVKNDIEQMNIANIEATEDNRSMMKKMRATLNKELNVFEEQRKMIHGKITEPYNEFKLSYESNIKGLYESATKELKDKIADVENRMLSDKKTTVLSYFDNRNTHEFITLDNIGLNIILSATDKKLKLQIDDFLGKIDAEVKSINAMDNSIRILGYYQRTLDLPDSISSVTADIKREQELEAARIEQEKLDKTRKEKEAAEAKKQAEMQAQQAKEKATLEAELAEQRSIQAEKNAKIQATKEAEEAKKQAEHDLIMAQEKKAEAIELQERLKKAKAEAEAKKAAENKIYTACFEIKATLKQMQQLKQYLKDNNITFKGIGNE